MARYIPDEVIQAEKQGFSAPDASWFKGESLQYVKGLFFSPKARIYDYFDPSVVRELLQEHLDGKVNRRLFIWSLINFEWWLRKFLV